MVRTGIRRGPVKTPRLTDEDVQKILEVTKDKSRRNWLIPRLIVECGCKPAQIIGERTIHMPGIYIEDLKENPLEHYPAGRFQRKC